jgi:hypothetical protein
LLLLLLLLQVSDFLQRQGVDYDYLMNSLPASPNWQSLPEDTKSYFHMLLFEVVLEDEDALIRRLDAYL